jgi:hypothetical protein
LFMLQEAISTLCQWGPNAADTNSQLRCAHVTPKVPPHSSAVCVLWRCACQQMLVKRPVTCQIRPCHSPNGHSRPCKQSTTKFRGCAVYHHTRYHHALSPPPFIAVKNTCPKPPADEIPGIATNTPATYLSKPSLLNPATLKPSLLRPLTS